MGLSTSVCITDPNGDWPTLQDSTLKELSEYGEIARLDTSLFLMSRCIIVTFFDVRAAQKVLTQKKGKVEPFPAASHDCRSLWVNMVAFAEEVGAMCRFNQYGEVASISMHRGDVIVEFYDIRAAQMLLAVAGRAATPWLVQGVYAPASSIKAVASLGQKSFSASSERGADHCTLDMIRKAFQSTGAGNAGLPHPPGLGVEAAGFPSFESLSTTISAPGMSSMAQSPVLSSEEGSHSGDVNYAEMTKAEPRSNRPMRTKVAAKEFSKFDIDQDKILCGEDSRTTVMVRNLTGQRSRKDFLAFLDKCGLNDRYTFFYMPCKEHRNVPAGFAFVNFVSPIDVHKLFVLVKSGCWRDYVQDMHAKSPAVSYARFQGHEELVKHFSSSAVLHENDVDKRPIFRPWAGQKEPEPVAGNAALKALQSVRPKAPTKPKTASPQSPTLDPNSELYQRAFAFASLANNPLNPGMCEIARLRKQVEAAEAAMAAASWSAAASMQDGLGRTCPAYVKLCGMSCQLKSGYRAQFDFQGSDSLPKQMGA